MASALDHMQINKTQGFPLLEVLLPPDLVWLLLALELRYVLFDLSPGNPCCCYAHCIQNNGSITSPASRACCIGFKPSWVGFKKRCLASQFSSGLSRSYNKLCGRCSLHYASHCRFVILLRKLDRCYSLTHDPHIGHDEDDQLTEEIPDGFQFTSMDACAGATLEGAKFAVS